jgi:hypothetical protein
MGTGPSLVWMWMNGEFMVSVVGRRKFKKGKVKKSVVRVIQKQERTRRVL